FTDGNDSRYKENPIGSSNNYTNSKQYSFYQNTTVVASDTKPFAVTIFEPSPLNRPIEKGNPGQAWQPDATHSYISTDRTIKSAYHSNLANEVLKWSYTQPSTAFPLGLVNASNGATPIYYGANQLYKVKTKDEQRNEVITYTDKLGRIILKRVQATTSNSTVNDTNFASTYYIYDDKGNLVAVIQPEGIKNLGSQYFGKTDTIKETYLKN